MMNLWELLKVSKGLPPPDLETLMLASKISDKSSGSSTITLTANGYPCVLENSVGLSTVGYKIYGNSIQNGTPSPDNPVEVQSVGEPVFAKLYDSDGFRLADSDGYKLCSQDVVGYCIPVVTSGKNLFDFSQWVGQTARGMTIYRDSIKGTPTYRWHRFPVTTLKNPIPAGTQVTVSYHFDTTCPDKGNIGVDFCNKNNIEFHKETDKPSGYTNTFVLEEDCYSMGLFMCMLPYTENEYCEITNIKIQLELSAESTAYEPYRTPITTDISLNNPLKIGDILKYPEGVIEHSDGTKESISLPQIPTFSGTTIISTDIEVEPSDIEITYKSRR